MLFVDNEELTTTARKTKEEVKLDDLRTAKKLIFEEMFTTEIIFENAKFAPDIEKRQILNIEQSIERYRHTEFLLKYNKNDLNPDELFRDLETAGRGIAISIARLNGIKTGLYRSGNNDKLQKISHHATYLMDYEKAKKDGKVDAARFTPAKIQTAEKVVMSHLNHIKTLAHEALITDVPKNLVVIKTTDRYKER